MDPGCHADDACGSDPGESPRASLRADLHVLRLVGLRHLLAREDTKGTHSLILGSPGGWGTRTAWSGFSLDGLGFNRFWDDAELIVRENHYSEQSNQHKLKTVRCLAGFEEVIAFLF